MRKGLPQETRIRGALVAALFLAGVAGCARPGSPRGGDVPELPLEVVTTSPEQMAVVQPFDDAISFQFDRRVSERATEGQLRDGVVVSPRTGEISVEHRRSGLEVRMEGGFSGSTVYRVTLLPTIQDLWQNTLGASYDLFFSTGPEFEPNVLAGLVTDRLTGEDAVAARVDAVPGDGGPVHSTVTDSIGIFTFPYLPSGSYSLLAFDDLNRNREPDFLEPQDLVEVDLALGDTIVVTELAILPPDTTPAVLLEAEPVDSLGLSLEFDDHLDPGWSPEGVVARLIRDEGDAPEVVEVLHLHQWEARLAAEAEAAREEGDEEADVEEAVEVEVEEAPASLPDDFIPPAQVLVLVLNRPLDWATPYRVELEGVTNLHGLPGGGGEADFVTPEEPVPDPEVDPGDGDDAGDGDGDTDDDGGVGDGS
ncbi:MAG: Ig-like domain-containing protein [Gemmatimonadota bacterium]